MCKLRKNSRTAGTRCTVVAFHIPWASRYCVSSVCNHTGRNSGRKVLGTRSCKTLAHVFWDASNKDGSGGQWKRGGGTGIIRRCVFRQGRAEKLVLQCRLPQHGTVKSGLTKSREWSCSAGRGAHVIGRKSQRPRDASGEGHFYWDTASIGCKIICKKKRIPRSAQRNLSPQQQRHLRQGSGPGSG